MVNVATTRMARPTSGLPGVNVGPVTAGMMSVKVAEPGAVSTCHVNVIAPRPLASASVPALAVRVAPSVGVGSLIAGAPVAGEFPGVEPLPKIDDR